MNSVNLSGCICRVYIPYIGPVPVGCCYHDNFKFIAPITAQYCCIRSDLKLDGDAAFLFIFEGESQGFQTDGDLKTQLSQLLLRPLKLEFLCSILFRQPASRLICWRQFLFMSVQVYKSLLGFSVYLMFLLINI